MIMKDLGSGALGSAPRRGVVLPRCAVPPKGASTSASAETSRLSSHMSHWKSHRVPKRRRRWEAIRVRLATWNVNSVKARLPRLLQWLETGKTRHRLPAGVQDDHGVVPRGRGQRARL